MLARRLAAVGIRGAVEARGSLAVLTLDDVHAIRREEVRAAALRLAREHGFTHLALEPPGAEDDAALPRG